MASSTSKPPSKPVQARYWSFYPKVLIQSIQYLFLQPFVKFFFIFYFYFNFLDYLQFFQILTTVSSHLWFILESTKKNKTTLTTTVTINFFSFFHKRRVNRNSSPCPPF